MNKRNLIIIVLAVLVIFTGGFFIYGNMNDDNDLDYEENTPNNEVSESQEDEVVINNGEDINMTQATLKTSKGDIVLEFYPELAPMAVKNFQDLAKDGFYDGVIFHRVIEGFMIQGGDPNGTGRGGPGYTFEDELDPESEIAQRGYVRGVLAMANSGPDTNGSQFFIMHKDYPLPYNYTIFGKVVDGMDVVDSIATTETGAMDKPVEGIVIEEVEVSEN
ncbi:MAG: peptidylprolyl isomerase [Patescibacteria group bacterium]